jgi:hypothetical protein
VEPPPIEEVTPILQPRTKALVDNRQVFRMRARDVSLNKTVFWNTPTQDLQADHHEGPGPVVDVVVSKTFQAR